MFLLTKKWGYKFNTIVFTAIFFLLSPFQASLASSISSLRPQTQLIDITQSKYKPYIELGGVKHFNQQSTGAVVYDFFFPLIQKSYQLLYTDLRLFDKTGSSFEGNVHLGYRQLNAESKKLYGIYGSLDRRKTNKKGYFSQLVLGGECWQNNWFIGGNIYRPIGKTKEHIGEESREKQIEEQAGRNLVTSKITITNKYYERSLPGVDAELGYAFPGNLTGYAGGYYFSEKNVQTVTGPKIRLTYDYQPSNPEKNKKIWRVFDKISIETGIQHDKPRGTSGYIEIKLKIGLLLYKTSNISGFERHMIELARRDPDIVVGEFKRTEQIFKKEYHQEGNRGFIGGSSAKRENDLSTWTIEELLQELSLLKDAKLQEVKRRYRKLALKHHPDRGGKAEDFIKVQNIYEELKDRLEYTSHKKRNTEPHEKKALPSSYPSQLDQPGQTAFFFNLTQVPLGSIEKTKTARKRNNKIKPVSHLPIGLQQNNRKLFTVTVRNDGYTNSSKRLLKEHTHDYYTKAEFKKTKLIERIPTIPLGEASKEFANNGIVLWKNSNKQTSLTTSDRITRLDYKYNNFDLENLMLFRLLELTKKGKYKKEGIIVLSSPITRKSLSLLDQERKFQEYFKRQTEKDRNKMLIPLYLDDREHWGGILLVKHKAYLEIKYFDSMIGEGPIKEVDESDSWLMSMLGNLNGGKVNFSYGNAIQQPNNSVGCGAFAIESIINGLDITSSNVLLEEEAIRHFHSRLFSRHKGESIPETVEKLKEQGVFFVDLNREFCLDKTQRWVVRGGGRRKTEEDPDVVDSDNFLSLFQDNIPKGDTKEAEETSYFQGSYNAVYQLINDHEYLLAPLSGAAAGGIRGGIFGAIAGGLLGLIDEGLIYFHYTNKHYLTWGTFGIATGHVFKPSITSDVIGATVGLLLPTGMPTEVLNEHKELIAPVTLIFAEGARSGVSGMVNGGMLGAMDEMLIHHGITDKHYLTFTTISMSIVNTLGWFTGMPFLSDSLGIVFGMLMANYEEEIFTTWIPIKMNEDLYRTYSKILPEGHLYNYIEKQLLVLASSQLAIQLLNLKLMSYQQRMGYNFEHLDSSSGQRWNKFTLYSAKVAFFIVPYVIGHTVSVFVNDYFCIQLYFTLEDELRSKWLLNETALRLSYNKNTTLLIDNLKGDASIIADSGSKLVTSSISVLIEGLYGTGVIISNAPDILVYSTLYNQACSIFSDYLAEIHRNCEKEIKAKESEIMSIVKHDSRNIRIITERGGIEFTKMKLQSSYDTLRTYESKKRVWKNVNELFRLFVEVTDFTLNYYLVGYKINLGTLQFEDRIKVHFSTSQISKLLSWSGKHAAEIVSVYQSLDRVDALTKEICNNTRSQDQINRKMMKGKQLILDNVEISIRDRILVFVENLELTMGKIYAITGESGSGKTSLLSKIRGIRENAIGGKGDIYYPLINEKKPKIVMISQQDYFPLNSNLLDIVFYPETAPSDLILRQKEEERIKFFLKELGMNISDLNRIKDWYTILSGGEKKKIMLISAIIKNPDILILDEIFNGLDRDSVILAQQMIKEHLPNALILIVDHHANENNLSEFYDIELHFSNRGIILKEITERA